MMHVMTGRVVLAFVVGFWTAIAAIYFVGGYKMRDCKEIEILLTVGGENGVQTIM